MTKPLVADNIRYKGFCYVLEENEVKIIRILYGSTNYMENLCGEPSAFVVNGI